MSEQFADLGAVSLCYETFGDPADPALLLVMGLGTQMVAWREDFCAQLVERGFFVIRFDNRDCGRSTWKRASRLGELADDAAGLLDHLGIERAHIVGASMGGMIAQHLGFTYPGKVLSLTSIMASTGHRLLGQPKLSVIPLFVSRPAEGKEAYVESGVALFRKIGSSKYFDEQGVREIASLSWDRGVNFAGTGRQLGAIVADGNRTSRLRRISAPALVIHGTADRLVAPSGGRATAKAIPGAKLLMIDGMGHDLPRALWPRYIDAITENTARADEWEVVASPAT